MPPRKGKPPARRRKGVKLKPTELTAAELGFAEIPDELRGLADAVTADGGAVLTAYREPLGGHPLLFAALPVDLVEPTPFQRDISDAHIRKLVHAMDKTRRFLDPIIAVREPADGKAQYWTPNGFHRLTAVKELGGRCILALLVPERDVAYQILALNIEKAHNLRERAISVVRMVHDLAALDGGRTEEDYALELEEPALVTLGFAYEKRPKLSGGAYNAALHKVDRWFPGPLRGAVARREERAGLLLELDDAVSAVVDGLKQRGFTSPYLRTFVVSRINPLRFMKGELPGADDLLATMTKRARGMNLDRIKQEDIARTGGAPEAAE